MSIATAITAAQGRVANAYTAISAKGGTLPQTQNLANMPAAINSIPSGGGSTKYGIKVDDLLGNIDTNGMLQIPTNSLSLDFSGVEDLDAYALYYKFYSLPVISVDFSNLKTISGNSAANYAFYRSSISGNLDLSSLITVSGISCCYYMFNQSNNITSVDLSSLTTISGNSGCSYMFYYCEGITSINLSALKTVSGPYGCNYMFGAQYGRSNSLTSVTFNSLSVVTGQYSLQSMFQYRTSLQSIYFPALTSQSFGSYTNQFNNMLKGITGCTVHFPSNLQSVIGSWASVTNGFDGTNTTVLFDLPATE